MFDKIGQFSSLMKQVGAMKSRMKEIQESLEAERHTADAGGGAVEATVNGKGELKGLRLGDEAVAAGDREMLEDLIVAAVNAASAKATAATQQRMSELTGGMDLGGLLGQ